MQHQYKFYNTNDSSESVYFINHSANQNVRTVLLFATKGLYELYEL